MSNQESQMQNAELQDSEGSDPLKRLALLRLESLLSAAATTTADASTPARDHCTMCGGNMKRRSPSPSSLHDPCLTPDSQPRTKKISLEPTSAADQHHRLHGFTKIPLPISTPFRPPSPVLRRCCSDPVNSPGTPNPGAPATQSPESLVGSNNAKAVNGSAATPSPSRGTGSASLPPLPPTLRRSVSDPTQSTYKTPPRPARTESQMANFLGPRTLSRSSSSVETDASNMAMSDSIKEESPNSKRLHRMKERMREMSIWWDEVMREGQEEEDGGSEVINASSCAKDGEFESDTEEAVCVENVGESLRVHFRCPCGKGYQILLSGKNCFYKLI
ncbi:uncharacterized protein LOC131151280 [Malania oleifera]|uniref:uncharacterized protein LOC131151280 n=1 Tax=Malania oleifera TaxID=397392 RepID=UPI0025AE5871|nr:uncharacterized protein LOC131151280 [Malania oleifera]